MADKISPELNQQPGAESPEAASFRNLAATYSKPVLFVVILALVAALLFSAWRTRREANAEAASRALFFAQSPEELQQSALTSPSAPTAPAALFSAASAFCNASRFEEALEAANAFLAAYPSHEWAPAAAFTAAASLEALERYDEAVAAYDALASAESTPDTWVLQARNGQARSLQALARFDEARAIYEDLSLRFTEANVQSQINANLQFLAKAERASTLPLPDLSPAEPAPEAIPEAAPEAAPEAEPEAIPEPAPETEPAPAE